MQRPPRLLRPPRPMAAVILVLRVDEALVGLSGDAVLELAIGPDAGLGRILSAARLSEATAGLRLRLIARDAVVEERRVIGDRFSAELLVSRLAEAGVGGAAWQLWACPLPLAVAGLAVGLVGGDGEAPSAAEAAAAPTPCPPPSLPLLLDVAANGAGVQPPSSSEWPRRRHCPLPNGCGRRRSMQSVTARQSRRPGCGGCAERGRCGSSGGRLAGASAAAAARPPRPIPVAVTGSGNPTRPDPHSRCRCHAATAAARASAPGRARRCAGRRRSRSRRRRHRVARAAAAPRRRGGRRGAGRRRARGSRPTSRSRRSRSRGASPQAGARRRSLSLSAVAAAAAAAGAAGATAAAAAARG